MVNLVAGCWALVPVPVATLVSEVCDCGGLRASCSSCSYTAWYRFSLLQARPGGKRHDLLFHSSAIVLLPRPPKLFVQYVVGCAVEGLLSAI